MLKNLNLNILNNLKSGRGYSLIEVSIAISLCVIISYVTASLYIQTVQAHRRQQRVLQTERSLLNTHHSLKQSLKTFPARNLGFTAKNFSIPLLPSIGNTNDFIGVSSQPIRLGIVTPAKVNGTDAFILLYSDAKLPKLALSQDSTILGDTGTARIALPRVIEQYTPPPGGGGVKGITNVSDGSTKNLSSVKGTPTPSPSPSSNPSPSPSPSPEPTKLPNPGGNGNGNNHIAVPPNIPITQTLSGLPYYASSNFYNIGDVMLLVGVSPSVGRKFTLASQGNVQADSRLVKITSVSQGVQIGNKSYINFTYDLCVSGECDSEKFPGVVNVSTSPLAFRSGSTLLPIKIASFYLKTNEMGSYLVRNDGGVILPDGNGGFRVRGGQEINLGEVDKMVVKYELDDGTIQNTPVNPNVPWVNKIKSVDISLSRAMPQLQKGDDLTRNVHLNFPLIIRHFE